MIKSTSQLINSLFDAKTEEKRNEWIKILNDEEFDTVEDLKLASDAVWNDLKLPLAVKDKLKTHVKTLAKDVSKVDDRLITQLDVIVFDISSSMNSKSMDPLNTRLGAAKILFHTMIDKLVGHELPHALGLVLFGEKIRWIPFTRDYESFHTTMGDAPANENSTILYDAVLHAAKKLLEFKDTYGVMLSPDCKSRIFCLTDGEDNASRTPYWEVSQFCQKNNIILDSIPVAAENIKLKKMSLGTGGLSLRVTDMEKGASLFEREAVIKLCSRDMEEDIPIIINESSLDKYNVVKAVEDIVTATPKAMSGTTLSKEQVNALLLNVTKSESTTNNNNSTTSSPFTTQPIYSGATKRILKEYTQFNSDPVPGAQCFLTQDDIFFWKLIISGPAGTPYEGGLFACYVKFPADYPFKPMDFRFSTPIYHPNVNNDGKVCIEILKSSWSPALTINNVIVIIMDLMKEPNPIDALDAVKANLYSDNKPLFNQYAKQHTLSHASKTLETLKTELHIQD